MNRVIEQGLPAYLLREIDLVVFPHKVDGRRYVSHVVEILSASAFDALAPDARASDDGIARRGGAGVVEKGGTKIHWNTVAWRDIDGTFHLEYDHPTLDVGEAGATTGGTRGESASGRDLGFRFFHRLAERTDRGIDAVEAEFHRKHGYVRYLETESIDDFEDLFEFLSDLRTDEAATVERAVRTANDPTNGTTDEQRASPERSREAADGSRQPNRESREPGDERTRSEHP